MDFSRVEQAYLSVRNYLFAERTAHGYWTGELSSSALSTATAVAAIHLCPTPHAGMVTGGLKWLAENQNSDGGWGDTVRSVSNISTTMLCRAAFHITGQTDSHKDTLMRCEAWLAERYGKTPQELAEAVRNRYGKDRTFSVPILMMCALGGLVEWREVPRLPYELAALPQSWYRLAKMPVVSYALPALIAIGQVIHYKRGIGFPLTGFLRWLTRDRTLTVLKRIQPSSGGYLEATPLTSFVCMSLCSAGLAKHRVVENGIDFLKKSVRADGSWPIDTDLATWMTTLSVNALARSGDLANLANASTLLDWLLSQQSKYVHPYTGAGAGSWGWTFHPGSVPDCDDTPSAVLAIENLAKATGRENEVIIPTIRGQDWMIDLQNRDGGFPTFCKGWGKLPFDRSGSDLTAHALRALRAEKLILKQEKSVQQGFAYLTKMQRSDGSWLPLWFGNQHAPNDENPIYGTSRVLAAYRDWNKMDSPEAQKGIAYLLECQNPDGGWGGAKNTPSSLEETALVIEILAEAVGVQDERVIRGVEYLLQGVEKEGYKTATPIGFYFAKLWYFEKLYPVVFLVAALGTVRRRLAFG